MLPAKIVDSVRTKAGTLELVQRSERDFQIRLNHRIVMVSTERASEEALARLACEPLAGKPSPRVLIGGLGMGYTLRAALDTLPAKAQITVAELTPEIDAWCKGPLAPLTAGAALDPRVQIVIDDFAKVVARAKPESLDAIVVDLYEGPHDSARHPDDPLYGRKALARCRDALVPGGVLAVWSEKIDPTFTQRLKDFGFETSVHHPSVIRAYVVYLGVKGEPRKGTAKPPRR